jgi:membrane protein implicated in regulation of membrane protease activity
MEPLSMRSKSRRATIIWLIMIALLLGVVLVSGALTPQAQLLLVAGYALLALLGSGFFTSQELRSRLPELPATAIPCNWWTWA